MLRPDANIGEVYLCRSPVDMRKSIDGLSSIVAQQLELDPLSEQLFVFCNRKRDKVKILLWERNGFIVWYKRLEKQRFKWPSVGDSDGVTLSGQELNWLLDGFDLWRNQGHQRLHYESVV